MIEDIFESLPDLFVAGTIKTASSYYFSLEDVKKTVKLTPDKCLVEDGKTLERADCVCKTSKEVFAAIWYNGYRPGVADFLAGKIKSNDPAALQRFLTSFGKPV